MTGGPSGRGTLERNHLPLWKVGALGLAYMMIGPSMAMSAGALIQFSAQAAWLSNLLSVTVLTLLALVISGYARRYVVTGSLVSYAYEALGARARLFVAACMMLGYVALTATLILGVVVFTGSALLDLGMQSAGEYAGAMRVGNHREPRRGRMCMPWHRCLRPGGRDPRLSLRPLRHSCDGCRVPDASPCRGHAVRPSKRGAARDHSGRGGRDGILRRV